MEYTHFPEGHPVDETTMSVLRYVPAGAAFEIKYEGCEALKHHDTCWAYDGVLVGDLLGGDGPYDTTRWDEQSEYRTTSEARSEVMADV